MSQYRYLEKGDTLQIGDEFQQHGDWIRLDENTYKEWLSYATTYQPDTMCPFRRSLTPRQEDVEKSRIILQQIASEVAQMGRSYHE
jgi:hypothetical protein